MCTLPTVRFIFYSSTFTGFSLFLFNCLIIISYTLQETEHQVFPASVCNQIFLQVFPETSLLGFSILLLQAGLASPGLRLPSLLSWVDRIAFVIVLLCFVGFFLLLLSPSFCPPTSVRNQTFWAFWFGASTVNSQPFRFLISEDKSFSIGWSEMKEWRGLRTVAGTL